jgi:hypothetical protein
MNVLKKSNSDPKMAASKTFQQILDQITSSNLNFQLQLSPFAAQISLKKSLVRDKLGTPLLPKLSPSQPQPVDSDIATLARRNIHLEKRLESLRYDYDALVLDCESSHTAVSNLEKHLGEVTNHHDTEMKKETELLEKELKSLHGKNRNLFEEN